ncbi:uncharacterized protein LOC110816419 [Carica papaya]|uniref:uncharacterized protein LOC110816419 n=1 Tax=Carica papaya TaxID=3649 RepID=UPI000B8CD9FB|nr:uncharacterized protein LOC110816419 [Carica papaya]
MLKNLDDRGAESMVDAISSRVQKLRDDELHFQLIELIEGFRRMWAFLAKIHQKQLQAIAGIKVCVRIAGADIPHSSGIKAIQSLEKEILNWVTCFNNYMNFQKTFVKNLNEWLFRCILQEPEETSDGTAPFSPSRMGAPHIFTVCNDWYHAIGRVSERGVSEAMQNFALRLHHLQEMQAQEMHQRHKSESLSKDFAKYMKNLLENGLTHQQQDMLLNNNVDVSGFAIESGALLADEVSEETISMIKRLDEQKARHEEAVKQVNDAASGCLQWCVAPIFEALESFCLQNLNAYEQIRIQNKDQSI